jgi:hypothetical protein
VQGQLSIQTLVIASLSSAAAALLTSLFWESGTVFSAAFTPVIVSIVSEALKKPAHRVSQVRAARRERTGPAASSTAPAPGTPHPADGPAPTRVVMSSDPPGPQARDAPSTSGRGGRLLGFARRRINLRLALVTGALAFVIAAVVLTLPELVTGQSIAGQPGRTTLGGGSSVDRSGEQTEPGQGEEAADPNETDPDASDAPADPRSGEDSKQEDPEAKQGPDATQDPDAKARQLSPSTRPPGAQGEQPQPPGQPPQQRSPSGSGQTPAR